MFNQNKSRRDLYHNSSFLIPHSSFLIYPRKYDPLDPVQVLDGAGFGAGKAAFEQVEHGRRFAGADLQPERAAGVQMVAGLLRDAAIEVQAVHAAVQRQSRLVLDLLLQARQLSP